MLHLLQAHQSKCFGKSTWQEIFEQTKFSVLLLNKLHFALKLNLILDVIIFYTLLFLNMFTL